MVVVKKIFIILEVIDVWIDGMKSLVIIGVILIFVWLLSLVIKELGIVKFLIYLLLGLLLLFLLLSLIFGLGVIIFFVIGIVYGIMGIFMLFVILLVYLLNFDMFYVIVSISVVLIGVIFGDYCFLILDIIIFFLMGVGCNYIDYVNI